MGIGLPRRRHRIGLVADTSSLRASCSALAPPPISLSTLPTSRGGSPGLGLADVADWDYRIACRSQRAHRNGTK